MEGNSWGWACTKLLEGERVRWWYWNSGSWIQIAGNGVVTRYSIIERRVMGMGHFRLDDEKMTQPGWFLYKDPPEVKRNEILFRSFI